MTYEKICKYCKKCKGKSMEFKIEPSIDLRKYSNILIYQCNNFNKTDEVDSTDKKVLFTSFDI